jgi:hypothetical protein
VLFTIGQGDEHLKFRRRQRDRRLIHSSDDISLMDIVKIRRI